MSEAADGSVRLLYLREHRVLLCESCQYCVLLRALDRHLKYIHHLPLAERERHRRSVEHLDIADAAEVVLPTPESAPVPGIPVRRGYACGVPDCPHLCAAWKRMQSHWRECHPQASSNPGSGRPCARRVRLQTFFQGNNLRYFIVRNEKRAESAVSAEPSIRINPPRTDDNESSVDWFLTKEFHDDTFKGLLPVAGSDVSWASQILAACEQADYLRSTMLSITATRVAYLHPHSRQLYQHQADEYRKSAIQRLPSVTPGKNLEDFFALFNFTRLMTSCHLARSQLEIIEGNSETTLSGSVLPAWVETQRQGRAVLWPSPGQGRGRIVDALRGPVQPLHNVERLSRSSPSSSFLQQNPDDHQLADLQLALEALPETDGPYDSLEALRMLRLFWAIPFHERVVCFRDIALMWTARVSAGYLSLVEGCEPAAMVVFAYYCVLWSYSTERHWYMEGHAETMLLRLLRRLDRRWRKWIEWPVSEVLGGLYHDGLDESHA